jgi:hypothetical protein
VGRAILNSARVSAYVLLLGASFLPLALWVFRVVSTRPPSRLLVVQVVQVALAALVVRTRRPLPSLFFFIFVFIRAHSVRPYCATTRPCHIIRGSKTVITTVLPTYTITTFILLATTATTSTSTSLHTIFRGMTDMTTAWRKRSYHCTFTVPTDVVNYSPVIEIFNSSPFHFSLAIFALI